MLKHAFYFVRHGVTDHNQSRLVMGQIDVALNEDGRVQSLRAARQLVGCGIRAIFASPLSRAHETATIIGEVLSLPVVTIPDLRERSWGVYEGRDRSERPLTADPEGGETLNVFTARILNAIQNLSGPHPALLVSHNGICRVLRRHFGMHTVEEMVPNAVPVCFSPLSDTRGWRETPVNAVVSGTAGRRRIDS